MHMDQIVKKNFFIGIKVGEKTQLFFNHSTNTDHWNITNTWKISNSLISERVNLKLSYIFSVIHLTRGLKINLGIGF